MASNYLKKGDVLDYTNGTGSAITSGQTIAIGAMIAVALVDIAIGSTGSVQVTGVWKVAKTAGTAWSMGDTLDFDQSAGEVHKGLTPGAGDITDGAVAAADAGSADTEGYVLLTPGSGTAN